MKSHVVQVVVVEDDEGMRGWICAVLGALEKVRLHLAEDAEAYLMMRDLPLAHVVILDLELPGAHGLELLAWLAEHRPAVSVLVFSGRASVSTAVRAMQIGAVDLLEKPASRSEFASRARALVEATRDRRRALAEANELRSKLETLTSRELDVLRLLVEGHANADVALALGISTRTAEGHRLRVLRKTAALSVTELTHHIHRLGLLPEIEG